MRAAAAAAACAGAAAALLLAPAPSRAQPGSDSISELAVKIASILTSAHQTQAAIEADAVSRDALVLQLRALGIAVNPDASAKVYATCGHNLRERACTAEVANADGVQVVSALQVREAGAGDPPTLALAVEPITAQREPMLDFAVRDDLLLVLERRRVTVRPRTEFSGELPPPAAAASLPDDRRWPRDMRGRLRAADGAFDVFLPAARCRGRIRPLSLACSDFDGGWPLALDNAGMVGNRNYFVTPEGFAFYGSAALGDANPERWLVADRQGVLTFLDADRSVVRRDVAADDVVRLAEPCADGVHVVAAGPSHDGSSDELRLLRVRNAALVPIAVWRAGGSITALWAEPGESAARTIVRNADLNRYEAFRVRIACAR